jgi:hypothetical protein
MVDKFIRAVELSDAALAAYVADPEQFIAAWLAGAAGPEHVADDRVLSADERAAFAARDYGELYRLGAHPYLLWHFTEAVYSGEFTAVFGWRDLVERYRAAIARERPKVP